MIGRLISLILLSTLSVTEMNEVSQQISLTVAKLGDNVTLTCALSKDDQGLYYWYKLNFGYMVQTVAEGSFAQISTQFNNSRFSARKVDNVLSLTIKNVSKEDGATYFCQVGSSFSMTFKNGTILAVNDPKIQHKFFTVKQTPDVNSVRLGDTMTLQCSLLSENKNDTDQCPDEYKVHWFKGASDVHPGIIYHGSIRNKEDGKCDYSLSKTITNSSDFGTYYCAVVTCGEILFGNGTKVEIEEFPLNAVLGALLTCSVLMNFALILSRKKPQPREHSKGKVEVFTDVEREKSSADQISNEEGEEVGLNYVALDFPSRKSSRWKSKKESPESTIYSGIREGQ